MNKYHTKWDFNEYVKNKCEKYCTHSSAAPEVAACSSLSFLGDDVEGSGVGGCSLSTSLPRDALSPSSKTSWSSSADSWFVTNSSSARKFSSSSLATIGSTELLS